MKMAIFTMLLLSLFFVNSYCFFETEKSDNCFCQLKGQIEDCSCNIDTVDHFNNVQIYPRLNSLLAKDYFKFYNVNLNRKCPYWANDNRCAIKYCYVESCSDENIPPALKNDINRNSINKEETLIEYENQDICKNDHNEKLGYLNTTISASTYEEFEIWKAHDEAQDNFCDMTEDDNKAKYVDLSLNPERYTGYRGESAHRIWRSIYMENCFRPEDSRISYYIPTNYLRHMCLEKRAFYRIISGIHASINTHLCAKYLLLQPDSLGLKFPNGIWGHNLREFQRRFSPESTNGEGPQWLKNLYFVYLLILRALDKASPYLQHEEFYTGNNEHDLDTRKAVKNLLTVVHSFENHFQEKRMFVGIDRLKLKEEYKQHFRNISKIMDCVGCDKCRLWGKLQIHGLGTAFKILFSGKFDRNYVADPAQRLHFQLQRNEIVALLNGFGRLSTSIYELENFRNRLR